MPPTIVSSINKIKPARASTWESSIIQLQVNLHLIKQRFKGYPVGQILVEDVKLISVRLCLNLFFEGILCFILKLTNIPIT